jgi:hypothetical protein
MLLDLSGGAKKAKSGDVEVTTTPIPVEEAIRMIEGEED